ASVTVLHPPIGSLQRPGDDPGLVLYSVGGFQLGKDDRCQALGPIPAENPRPEVEIYHPVVLGGWLRRLCLLGARAGALARQVFDVLERVAKGYPFSR